MGKVLTDAEENALDEYLKNGGVKLLAAQYAYPHITKWKNQDSQRVFATKLFNRPHIAERLVSSEKRAARKTDISVEWIFATLRENIERSMQGVPVLDANGNPKLVQGPDGKVHALYQYNPTAVNQAINMLMRHKGLFELDNRQRDSLSRAIEKMSPERLLMLSEKLDAIAGDGE